MSSLKRDIARLQAVVKAVNDLVALNLMQTMTETPHVYVIRQVLGGKDRKYMKNWCQNVLRVWVMTFVPEDAKKVDLVVFDKETGDIICRYSERKGLML